jgi:cytochrome b561
MMLRNTAEYWGAVSKCLHWVTAIFIIALLGLGLIMVHANMGAATKFEAYQLHKSSGFLILMMILARALWRVANSPPTPPDGLKPWERRLERALHFGLYILVLVMIASGWLMVSASPLRLSIRLPGGFTVPDLIGPNDFVGESAKFLHKVVSKLLIGAIVVHVAGALKHHFVDRDNVLLRILPFAGGTARHRNRT